MGLQPLNRYLLGANWMYDRDIVFDLNEKMIHIYDNVQCGGKKSEVMGHYTTKIENNTDINFSDKPKTKLKINTNSLTFMFGIACLVFAVILAILLCINNKQNEVTLVSTD